MDLGATQGRPLSVRSVRPDSAAARIGLQSGDEVISLGGQQIANERDFNRALQAQLGASRRNRNFQIPVVVRRNGRLQTYYWTNVALALAGYGPLLNRYGYYVPPRYTTGYRGPLGAPAIPNNPGGAYLGVELNREYPNAAIVSRVYDGTPAAEAGLRAGDRIWAVNNQRVESIDELIHWIARMEPGQRVAVSFDRPHSLDVVLGDRGQTQTPRAASDGPTDPPSQPAEVPGPSIDDATTATPSNESP
jgi:S1-C subfamily serine protease